MFLYYIRNHHGRISLSAQYRLKLRKCSKDLGITKWYPSEIVYILKNERYMGDARLQKRYTSTTLPYRLLYNHGEKEQYYVENSNDAIVTREDFQAVQSLIEQRKNHNQPNDLTDNILAHVLE